MSKILARYAETGSIKPGSIGGSKPRLLSADIEQKIDEYKSSHPPGPMFVWDIRERLIRDGVCKSTSIPSLTTLARILRSAGHHVDESSFTDDMNTQNSETTDNDEEKNEKSNFSNELISIDWNFVF